MRTMPWDEIQTPANDYNVRLALGSGKIPVYWGKDNNGHCLFIIELIGDHSRQFHRDVTTVHGVRVDLRQNVTSGCQNLVLTLEKQVDLDLFFGLCETLTGSLAPVTNAAIGLAVVLTHIKRWKAFLAGRKKGLLSPEEVRGLFAELQFLRSMYECNLAENSAIEAWCGDEGVHQDFIFGNTAVEIKSLSGRERNTVHISSEDQLEGLSDNLFLVIYRLSEMPDSDRAISLNDAVCRIEGELTNAGAIEGFSTKLAAYGYAPMVEYEIPKFVVSSMHTYRVTDGFPRLIRSGLPEGVARLSYEIELEKIASYQVEAEQIFGR